jgi:hypothetical protein
LSLQITIPISTGSVEHLDESIVKHSLE